MKKRKRKKLLSFFLKTSLSLFLIILVLKKVDVTELHKLMEKADYKYFGIAMIMMFFSQLFGGLRMRYYFNTNGFNITKTYSVAFYFVGTLFNIILPGGIGGDGYRAYYMHKRFRFPWQKTIIAIVRGRASGLFFLCFFFISFAFFYKSHLTFIPYTNLVLIAGLLLVFPSYSLLAKYVLKEPVKIQIGAMKFSFLVQLFSLFAIIAILEGIGNYGNIIGYLLVFLIANIVAIIPISFGGVGLREYTYVTLAATMGLNSGIGVAASFLFYIFYTGVAFIGFIPYFLQRRLDLNEIRHQRSLNSKYQVSEEEFNMVEE